ncbi:MAG: PQQ-dependent sugar dehydrogenase [Acidobacteriota bacterium]
MTMNCLPYSMIGGLICLVCAWPVWGEAASDLPLEKIQLKPGFQIDIFADNLVNARSLALGAKGTVFVSTRTKGKVYAVVDEDGDHRADKTYTLAEGLFMPNGVAFRNGSLYLAEVNRVLRYDGIEDRLDNPPDPVVVLDGLPRDKHHGWKFIRFAPDGRLYVPIGAPCNICDPEDPRYASISRVNADGSGFEVFAHGVRNTVGFDWHPQTGELWFTDNGRDWLADESPPDELNHVPRAGMHFGYPYCHGDGIADPEFGKGKDCSDYTPPAQPLVPHAGVVGMRFYTGRMFPGEYRNQILLVEHGSWNRKEKVGYRIMLVRLKDSKPVSYEPFAEGWLQGNQVWGRPVDVEQMHDGSLLVSDDQAGVVYRISYKGQ